MSNVIDFIEKLGQDAQLRYATRTEVEQAMRGAQIDPEIRAAILCHDQPRLEALLGANTNVCCMIYSPREEGDDEQQTRKAKEDDKEKVASAKSAGRRIAAAV
jgi:hypothetical protein